MWSPPVNARTVITRLWIVQLSHDNGRDLATVIGLISLR